MGVKSLLKGCAFAVCGSSLTNDARLKKQCQEVVTLARRGPHRGILLDVGTGSCPCYQFVASVRPDVHYITQDFAGYTEGAVSEDAASTILKNGYCSSGLDIVSDITEIPLPDSSVDMIYCNSVLEHVPDPVGALEEITRVMKPGARLLIAVPVSSGLHNLPFHFYSGFTHRFFEFYAEKLGLEVENSTYYFTPWTSDAPRLYQTAYMFQKCLTRFHAKSLALLGQLAPQALVELETCDIAPAETQVDLMRESIASLELIYPDALAAVLTKLPKPSTPANTNPTLHFSGYVCPCRHLYRHKDSFGLTVFTQYAGSESHEEVTRAFNKYCHLEITDKAEEMWWVINFEHRRYEYRQGYASCSHGPRQPLSWGKDSAITWVGDFASLAEVMMGNGIQLRGRFLNLGAADGIWSDPLSRYAKQYRAHGIAVEADRQRCEDFRRNFPHIELFCFRLTKRTLPRVAVAMDFRDYDILKIDLDSYDCFVLYELLHVYGHRPSALIVEVNLAFPPPFEFAMEPSAAWDVINTATETTHFAFGCSLSYAVRLLTRTLSQPRYVLAQIYKTDALFVRVDLAYKLLGNLRTADEFECYHLSLLETGIDVARLRQWTYQENVQDTLQDMRGMIQAELSQRFGITASKTISYHLSPGQHNGMNASTGMDAARLSTTFNATFAAEISQGRQLVGFQDMLDAPPAG